MKLKLVVLVVLVAIGVGALAVTFGGLGANAATGTEYLTAAATVGDVTDDVAATGTLAAAESYGLIFGADPYLVGDDDSAPTGEGSWPVTEVTATVGDTVAEGDILATADTTALETDLERATADVRAANINVEIAKESLADAEDADDADAERQAKLALYGAQNQYSQAFEARRTIQQQIQAASLKAPIAGVVTEVNIRPGFDAPAGSAIVDRLDDVPGDDRRRGERPRRHRARPEGVDQHRRARHRGRGHGYGHLSGGRRRLVRSRGLPGDCDPHQGTGRRPRRHERRRDDHDRQCDRGPDRPEQRAAGHRRRLRGHDARRGRHAQRQPVQVGLLTSTTAEITSGLTEGTAVVTGTASDLIGTADQGSGRFGNGRHRDPRQWPRRRASQRA